MRLQHGFSLVEVLVTLLILNVGLLGVLAGQALTLRQLQGAIQRTHAVALSNSLFNEIRANQRLAELIGPQLNSQSEIPAAPDCSPDVACNAEQMAAAQLHNWFSLLQPATGAGLSDAEFCLQQVGGAARLSVSWQQRLHAAENNAAPCEVTAGRSGFAIQGGGW
jgi:type IV pilus assembly protein PilV